MYGIDVYLGSGLKLLSTAEMGVAFDITKSGINVEYSQTPNKFSQVEFPLSSIMGYYADTEQGVIDQFNSANSNTLAHKLCDNIYEPGSISYANGHIVKSTASLLGLTNTISSPVSSLINPEVPSYGLWGQGSLINIMQEVSAYMLKSSYIKRSHRMWMKLGTVKFNSPVMHLLILQVDQNDITSLYPADFSKPFSIGLFSKTANQEIYVIFSDADYIDIQVQVYSKYPGAPLYPGYGIETFRADGSKTFTSQNPPLLPIFVTNSNNINSIPSAGYKLGCVFSRVDSFIFRRGNTDGSSAACVFNGISWVSENKWSSALMGFTEGGQWDASNSSRRFKFFMGTFDSATWDWMANIRPGTTESGYVRYSLPYFAKDFKITKEDMLGIGVFMGVVVY